MRLPHTPLRQLRLRGFLAIVAIGLPTLAGSLPAEEPVAPAPHESAAEQAAGKANCPPRRCGLIPVCRRVPVTVSKPHTEYHMECALVCEPGCCLTGCLRSPGGGGCDRCGHATIRTEKRLVKKVTEKKIASHEYKVCWVCPACAGLGASVRKHASRPQGCRPPESLMRRAQAAMPVTPSLVLAGHSSPGGCQTLCLHGRGKRSRPTGCPRTWSCTSAAFPSEGTRG